MCDDFIGEPDETVELVWRADEITGAVMGTIDDDEPRLAVRDACTGTDQDGIAEADACASEDGSVVFIVERTVHPAVTTEPPEVSFWYVTLPNEAGVSLPFASPGGTGEVLDPCSEPRDAALVLKPRYHDYEPQSGQRTIAAGTATTTAEIAVVVEDDALDEDNETFRLVLCRGSDHAYIEKSSGLGVIVDNDDPPTLTVSDAAVAEPANDSDMVELSFEVSLSAVSGRDVRVNYYTDSVDHYDPGSAPSDVAALRAAAGDDYASVPKETPAELVFSAENRPDPQYAKVEVLHDLIDEGDDDEDSAEALALRLTAVNADFADGSGDCTAGLDTNDCALGRIIDNDAPPKVILVGPDAPVEEGDNAKFLVRLVDRDDLTTPMPSGLLVAVGLEAVHADSPDAPDAPDTLTAQANDLSQLHFIADFDPKDCEGLRCTEHPIEVGTVDDSVDEIDFETFQMRLRASTVLNAEVGEPAIAEAQILDNDEAPHVTLIDTCVDALQTGELLPVDLPDVDACTAEDAPQMRFTVALVDPAGNERDPGSRLIVSGHDVTVTYRTVQQPAGVDAATGGVDYVTVDADTVASDDLRTVVIAAGRHSADINVDLVDDDFHEAHETFQVELDSAENAAVLPRRAEGVIVDDEPMPLVMADDAEAVDEGEFAVFNLRLIHPDDRYKEPADQRPALSSRQLKVEYILWGISHDIRYNAERHDLVDASAVHWRIDSDPFEFGTVTFEPLTSDQSVSIGIRVDDDLEPEERFRLYLTNEIADSRDWLQLGDRIALGTINGECVDLFDSYPDPQVTLRAVPDTIVVDEDVGEVVIELKASHSLCRESSTRRVIQSDNSAYFSNSLSHRSIDLRDAEPDKEFRPNEIVFPRRC